MNDQLFVNAYIKILNDTLTEAFNKNLVMQAQLEVSKHAGTHNAELENKIRELTAASADVNALQQQINALKIQLEQANAQVTNKNSHVETFKRELVDARNIIKSQTVEIDNIKSENEKTIASLKSDYEQKIISQTTEVESVKSNVDKIIASLTADYEQKIALLDAELKDFRLKKKKKESQLNNIDDFISTAEISAPETVLVNDTF